MLVTLTFLLPPGATGEQLADIVHVAREAGERGKNWLDAVTWALSVFDGEQCTVVADDRQGAGV